MKFDRHFPTNQLKDYIKYYVVSENALESEYKVFPSTGLVMGFQYKGRLATISNNQENQLAAAGITGIANSYQLFKNSAATGTILVYFTETGFTHFAAHPANALFNLSLALEDIFDKSKVNEAAEKLALAAIDKHRIQIVEQFLLAHFKPIPTDKLIEEAVQLIYQSRGTTRIKELNEKLCISQSPFEKRFRTVVGTTAKKFASIVRFNAVLNSLHDTKTLTEIGYDNHFFDQAHFIKDFKQFTGETPENFKRFL